MTIMERLINRYEILNNETGSTFDEIQMKLKALMDFNNGRQLTDRQEELVGDILHKHKEELKKDLRRIEDNNDINMEFAQHLQNCIEEIDNEVGRLSGVR